MKLLSSLSFFKGKSPSPNQEFSSNWSDRVKVLESDVNMFCWTRSLSLDIQNYLQEAVEIAPPSIQLSIQRSELKKQLANAMQSWGAISSDGTAFWKDVFQLTNDFLDFQEKDIGSLYLRIIDNNACTKFHVDGYNLRLFTTYHGLGTEWVPEDALNRTALGTSNEKIIKKWERVQRLDTGHVAILKGEIPNRNNKVLGIVHRSPEIVNTGEKRIILRIDI